jgi:hypothetical protein
MAADGNGTVAKSGYQQRHHYLDSGIKDLRIRKYGEVQRGLQQEWPSGEVWRC